MPMKQKILFPEIKTILKITIFILYLLFGTVTNVFGQSTDDYRTRQTGNWNSLTTWERHNGTTWQTLTGAAPLTLPTSGDNNITILNGHIVAVTENVTVDQVVIETGGQITINNAFTLRIANGIGTDLNVFGTLQTNSTAGNATGNIAGIRVNGGASISFNSGGTYIHNVNGEGIPTASWDVNSNCLVTGVVATLPGGRNQNFGNLIWNNTAQTATTAYGALSITGNLTIQSTGSGQFNFTNATANTVGGDFIQTGGTVWLANTGATSLTVGGNFSLSGGNFNLSYGAGVGTLNVAGNFTHTGGTITESSTGSGAIVLNGSSMQTYTSGGAVTNTINFTVSDGAYLQMAEENTLISGGGTFTLASGAALGITSLTGITSSGATGNIQVTGTRTFDSGANYIYNGTSAQNTGNGLPATVSNLTFDNSGGAVTFDSETEITNNFTIFSGSVANLGTFTHSSGDLKLGGQGTVSGSWGHSSSSAINKNNTYFAATTGIVNVTNSKCDVVAIPAGIAASPSEVCNGSSTTLSVINPGDGFTTEWFTGSCGGTLVGTGNSLLVSPSASTTFYAHTLNTTTNCISDLCASTTVIVNELLPVSVNILSSPSGEVCEGTVVTFTAIATNGGSSPSYQWKVNGINVGINSDVYSYEPDNGDQVLCIITSDLHCVTGSASIPITYFSWNDNTKPVTDSDFGPDAISIGGGQYLAGGVDGTTALSPITVPKTDINLNLGNYPAYDTDGVDYSISYRRAEAVAQLFTRGNSLIISGGSVFNVSYRIDDGAGSFTTVTSSNFNIADDSNFHDYRFSYDPSDGYGRLFIDGAEVWTSSATLGKAMYWTGAGDLIIGANTDASGNLIPTFDNLSINGISLKTAADEVTLTVNILPFITTQPSDLTLCEGESGSFNVATSASSPTYQWGYATSPTPASWIDIPEGVGISGTQTAELNLVNIPVVYNGFYVNCLITANGCESRSSTVLLTVNPLPTTGEIIPD
jgi:hypothetical protein